MAGGDEPSPDAALSTSSRIGSISGLWKRVTGAEPRDPEPVGGKASRKVLEARERTAHDLVRTVLRRHVERRFTVVGGGQRRLDRWQRRKNREHPACPAPSRGNPPISAPRRAMKRIPSANPNIPAACAAATSPTL